MTQPPDPQLAALQQTMSALGDTVKDLTRAIQGDANTGSPSIRGSIDQLKTELTGKLDRLKDELDNETAQLCDRLDTLEQRQRDQDLTFRIYRGLATWAGGGSLFALITLAGLIWKTFGGGR